MTLYEQPVLEGWLHKDHCFTIRIFLKDRFFVLLDTKLLYFKQPGDKCPAGTIQSKYFHLVKIQRTGPLYGFRIVSQCTNHRSPVLYADSQEERHMWMTKIQSTLDALSGYNRLCDKIIANVIFPDKSNKTQSRKSYQPMIFRKNTPRSFCSLSTHESVTVDGSTKQSGYFSRCKSFPECSSSPVDEISIYKSLYPLISEDSIYEIEKTPCYPNSPIHIESERYICLSHINDKFCPSQSGHSYFFSSLPPPPRK